MRLSRLFTKTSRDLPRDETSKNAQLLIQAGYIHKEIAGVYDYLPLGLRVLRNIVEIIREEMNAIGGQEVELTALQDRSVWESTDRWADDKVDVWFKTKLQNQNELGLGFTHEEPLTRLMTRHISSYKDLPKYVYQFQTKFRNEIRAKSGIMRTREFLMKDLYSFSRTQQEHDDYYEQVKQAYIKAFDRIGIGDQTYVTFASGGSFSKFSHEFQTLSEAGEDTIYLDREKKLAVNREVLNDEVIAELGLNRDTLEEVKGVEAGNIFNLGTKFSEPLGLYFTNEKGQKKPVIMGSYGIGPGRVMGIVAELFSDEKGLIWPEQIAPARVHIVRVGEEEAVVKEADKFYDLLKERGVKALYDDRNLGVGEMLNDADLLGIPLRAVVSSKSIEQGGIEVKKRTEKEAKIVSSEELIESF
ncbi:MAG: aminoacyl--tRNA ligase-related protein [Candidatus Saccharimonadales bacterium]|nr:aminoacyl--tRNA ligase-related protein [Candidatus Saccharimonadales bacterium]